MTQISDMPRTAQYPLILFQFIHKLIDGTYRFIRRNTLFSSQYQWKLAVYRTHIHPIADFLNECTAYKLYSFRNIGMRCLPKAAKNGGILHIFLCQISMRITGYCYGQIGTGNPANTAQQVMLARTDILYKACAVQVKIDTVQILYMFLHSL